jgi:hypothetical protein
MVQLDDLDEQQRQKPWEDRAEEEEAGDEEDDEGEEVGWGPRGPATTTASGA